MTLPRIMVDGYNLALQKGTGIATYTRNLTQRLGALGAPVDVLYGIRSGTGARGGLLSEVDFFDPSVKAIKTREVVSRLATSRFGVSAYEVPVDGKVVSDGLRSRMPHFDRIFNVPDLFYFSKWHLRVHRRFLEVSYPQPARVAHWTYPMPVKLKGAANIYTIHDLVPLRLPYATLDNKREFHSIVSAIAKDADHIVTVSETSKRDIVDLLGVPEDKVTNTYQAVDLPQALVTRDRDEVAGEISNLFGLGDRDYYLFFGAIEPKKNVGRLIEAYLASGVKTPLVIVGALVWKNADDLKLLDPAGINDIEMQQRLRKGGSGLRKPFDPTLTRFTRSQVMRIEYLPFHQLVSMIRCAKGVLFPSLYEASACRSSRRCSSAPR
ncbi:glycosyltransferase [Methylobrevis pamukkalensis]|uniref:Glycosyltransferase subfamily 4-like N-terminal domain-containing protein n=1 Tax=Methylobrevis pamukkalensis TaxID=1439726 RepID=A0A1E3GYP5_9HYPH|nr:glycosyltransferase [Methylobrevis pamukkalensis]ODN69045.1 hypothetical protein A6302_03641 [Methylobrevis pamukkalensis]